MIDLESCFLTALQLQVNFMHVKVAVTVIVGGLSKLFVFILELKQIFYFDACAKTGYYVFPRIFMLWFEFLHPFPILKNHLEQAKVLMERVLAQTSVTPQVADVALSV